jgi:hypothetical protein
MAAFAGWRIIAQVYSVSIPIDDPVTGLSDLNTHYYSESNAAYVSIEPQVAIGSAPFAWSEWMSIRPIPYASQFFKLRIVVNNQDYYTDTYLTGFTWQIGDPITAIPTPGVSGFSLDFSNKKNSFYIPLTTGL